MFSDIFIRRPKTSFVVSIVLTLMGVLGFISLPVEQFPEIAPPVVKVSTSYTGANAETVENTVAAVIEEQVNGVDEMIYMSSDSTDEGSYSLTVTFEFDADADIAAVNVQNLVASALPRLPSEVTNSGVVTKKSSTNMLMVATISSPKGTYDEVFLSNYANINLRDALARVNGVGDASVLTDFRYAMRIWLDPDRMAGLGLTPTDVITAVREQNAEVSAGQVGTPPVASGQQFQYTITARGRLTSVDEFQNIVLRTGEAGSIVRLGDVAKIELGSSYYNASGRASGSPATVLAIYQAPGENALAVATGVKAELERLARAFPDDIVYDIPFDTTDYVEQSLKDVISTLILTFVLVIAVVYVFLGSFRATLIPAVAIPVSLIGAFAFLLLFGMSLNTISLFALVLAIGIVVDDAIVVVENVERIIADEGLDPKEATRKAMGQITGPIIATTLVLLAVFVPVTFMPGITGRLYTEFAVTISTAVVISSINALTLSPTLCSMVLKARSGPPRGMLAVFEKGVGGARNVYVGVVGKMMRLPIIALAIVVAMGISSGSLMRALPAGFVPLEDSGALFVDVQLPDAASLERTEVVTQRVTEKILQIPGVKGTTGVNGFSLMNGTGSNGGMIIVNLEPWDDRQSPELAANGVLQQIYAIANQEIAASVIAFNPPPIPGLGLSEGVEMKLQQTGGGEAQDLAAAVGSLVYAANQRPEIAQAYSTFRANVPKVFVDLDREKAKSLNVSVADIFATLQTYMGSVYINDFNLFSRTFRVIAQADGEFRNQVEDLEKLYVRSQTGDMVPLGTLVTIEQELGPTAYNRFNLFRAATITAVPAEGYATGDAIRVLEEESLTALPPGYAYEWTGTAFQQQEAAGVVIIILMLAILFAYLFLVAQYESWTMPVAILLTVTVALFGALAAVGASGGDVNIYTQIGMIMLVGLASKNAILIVEFAMEQRANGMTVFEAGMEAARQRFRAVMMTALSFLLGVVPLMAASGAGAASQKAIGVAVFGGMLAATVIGVALVPLLYVLVQRMREWTKARVGVQAKSET